MKIVQGLLVQGDLEFKIIILVNCKHINQNMLNLIEVYIINLKEF